MESQEGRGKRIGILFLSLFAVPLLGWLTSIYLESSYESQFRTMVVGKEISEEEYVKRGLSYLGVCGSQGALRGTADNEKLCSFADEIEQVRLVSLVTAGLGASLLLLIFGSKTISGTDRKRLSAIFGPMVRVVLLLLAVSVVVQAGLLVYSIYTLEAAAIGRVHGGILLGIGIGALFGCYQLLKSGLGLFKLSPLRLRGSLLARSDNSKIYHQVEQLASRLGAQAPDNIVVGLEPNFFVTSSAVELIGEKSGILEGKTLFISLSLMRILGIDELIAVIGHELGHFRGLDTEYSLKFAPVYSRLSSALTAMSSNDEGASALATLPAAVVLGVCLTEFATAERTVGRERELLADRAGAEAASATGMVISTMLTPVPARSPAW